MRKFIQNHTRKITGTIACFDRFIFKGYLPISWAESMERFMGSQGLLIKDVKAFVSDKSERVKQHGRTIAEAAGRPYISLTRKERKEEEARSIAQRDKITQGMICVFTTVEAYQTFKMVPGEKRPHLINARRKCLCLYFYFIDREFGFMHVRIPTWFPSRSRSVSMVMNGSHTK